MVPRQREGTVLSRGSHQGPPLARADSLHRGPKAVVRPCLDLNDHEVSAATADQVELAAPGPEAGPDHLIAVPPEEVRGCFLPGAAEL